MEKDKNQARISKGYRLKLSTHNMIKNLKEITQTDTDTILTESCILYYRKLIEKETINNNKTNKSHEK